jgi:hypothetical protein
MTGEYMISWFAANVVRKPKILVVLALITITTISVAIGVLAGLGHNYRMLAIASAPVILAAIVFVLRRFEIAVLAIPLTAWIAFYDLPAGNFTKIPIAMALTLGLCAIWITSMAIRHQWHLAPSPINKPLIAFSVTCVISLIWGIAWRDPILRMEIFGGSRFLTVQTGSLLCYLASIGAALLIGNFVQTTERLKFILGLFLFCGGISTILLVILRTNPYPLNPLGLWGLWFAVPVYALALLHPTLRFHWRFLLIVLILVHLYLVVVVNITWKSGWVPTIIGLFIVTWIRSKSAFLVLAATLTVILASNNDLVMQIVNQELEEGSEGRIGMWEINLRVIDDHWLFGTGPAGYAPYYMTYFPWDARSTHNNHLDILAQFGVVGTVLWWWLTISGTIEGYRLIRQTPPGILHVLTVSITTGWICAQIAMFFGDWVLPFAYNQTVTGFKYTVYTWIWFGMLISIRSILTTQQQQRHAAHAHKAGA